MKKKVYMAVDNEHCELPIAVADSIKELADMIGVKTQTIRSAIYLERKGKLVSKYKIVEIEEDEEGQKDEIG